MCLGANKWSTLSNMKLLLILYLCALIMPSWSPSASGQDPAAPTSEEKAPTTDENTNDTPAAPKRLPSAAPRAQVPADNTAYMETLGQALEERDKEVHWLDPNDRSFLTLWQTDRSGDAKGAVLILHGEGEHANWPHTIQPLHDTLPDYGWATLAISLPKIPTAKPPKRTLPAKVARKAPTNTGEETADTTEASDTPTQADADTPATAETSTPLTPNNDDSKDTVASDAELAKIIEQRLSTALQFLHDRGQFNIVFVSHNSNAIYAHQFIKRLTPKLTDAGLKRQLEKPVRAMIIVNASNRLTAMQADYTEWFNDPELMVLDILTSQLLSHQHDSKKRKVLAKQNKVTTYKNVTLPPLSTTSWGENLLSRRIRSFLDANVQGVQVDRAAINR